MTTYIAVYEDYTPELFKSAKAMGQRFSGYFLDEDGTEPATPAAIVKAIKAGGAVRIYPEGSTDWVYKVFAA